MVGTLKEGETDHDQGGGPDARWYVPPARPRVADSRDGKLMPPPRGVGKDVHIARVSKQFSVAGFVTSSVSALYVHPVLAARQTANPRVHHQRIIAPPRSPSNQSRNKSRPCPRSSRLGRTRNGRRVAPSFPRPIARLDSIRVSSGQRRSTFVARRPIERGRGRGRRRSDSSRSRARGRASPSGRSCLGWTIPIPIPTMMMRMGSRR